MLASATCSRGINSREFRFEPRCLHCRVVPLTSLCFAGFEGWEAVKTIHLGNPHRFEQTGCIEWPVEEVTNDGATTVFAFHTYTLRPFQRQPNIEHPCARFCSSPLLRKLQRGACRNCRGLAEKASRAAGADRL